MTLRLPDDVYDLSVPLLLDEQVAALRTAGSRNVHLAERWHKEDNPIEFARGALYQAFCRYVEAKEQLMKGEWKADWERGFKLTENVDEALRQLLLFLAGSNSSLKDFGVAAVAQPLSHMISRLMFDVDVPGRTAWAKSAAQTLIDARSVTSSLMPAMNGFRREIAAGRQNPGDPQKAAFVKALAEAWLSLTDRMPGKGSGQNPFLNFVDAAWADLGGPRDESFVSALRSALAQLRNPNINPRYSGSSWNG